MSSGFVDGLGSLALLGSVGFGVFAGMKDPSWSYEIRLGMTMRLVGSGSGAVGRESNVWYGKVELCVCVGCHGKDTA